MSPLEYLIPLIPGTLFKLVNGPHTSHTLLAEQHHTGVCAACGNHVYAKDHWAQLPDHTLCVFDCKNCGQKEDEHARGWCLFKPTKFEKEPYRVEIVQHAPQR